MIKVAFLDRDGTINKDYDDNVWKNINNPEILDGNIEGLKKIKYYGYIIIIITNQYIIADGIISKKQYQDFNLKLIKLLKKEGIDNFNIDIMNSFYIGDSYSDYKLAKKFNLKFYGIKGKNNDDIFKYNNILEVINEREK